MTRCKRGYRRRDSRSAREFPGGAVKNCITVIGNDGELSAFVNVIAFHLPDSCGSPVSETILVQNQQAFGSLIFFVFR
jgi:hypothetical protein